MLNKKAFTLIELLIYMFAFAFFAVLAFGFLLRTQQKIFYFSNQNEKLIRANLALDLLKRDLLCASFSKSDWDLQGCIFKKTVLNKDGVACPISIGWNFDSDSVSRIEGEYDFVNKKWRNKILSKVCAHCMPIKIHVIENKNKDCYQRVVLLLENSKKDVIFLENRRVG
jgi:type II secretory pathway component PulJ